MAHNLKWTEFMDKIDLIYHKNNLFASNELIPIYLTTEEAIFKFHEDGLITDKDYKELITAMRKWELSQDFEESNYLV